MSWRREVLVSLAVVAALGSSLIFTPSAHGLPPPLTWTLTGADFANGIFQNTTVANGDLQFAHREAPTNRTMVVDVGPPGSPDSQNVFLPSVWRETDGTFKMWYTGYTPIHDSILFATSPDGLQWTKHGVVMDVSNGAATPFVLKVGSVYHMWFTNITWCCTPLGYLDQIYHATSADGMTWTNPTFALGVGPVGSWEPDSVTQPWVVRDTSGLYRMYYVGTNDQRFAQIGVATSSDLVNWTKGSGNPIFTAGSPSSWDSMGVVSPSVVIGSPWEMYYASGTNASCCQIGLATSADGTTWTKSVSNPMISPEPSPAWDDASVGSPVYVAEPSGPVLYFAGGNGTNSRIGVLSFAPPPKVGYNGSYVSAVFDSGAPGTTWMSLASNAAVPPGTGVRLRARSGNASSPDGSWSSWVASANVASLPRTRYAQLAVDLTSPAWNLTPTVSSVTLGYAPNEAPTAIPWSPSSSAWTNASQPVLRWNLSDPEGDRVIAERVQMSPLPGFLLVTIDSGNLTPGTTSWKPPLLTQGLWYWRVQAEDTYGAWSAWETSQLLIDTSPPELSVSSPAPGVLLHVGTVDVIWNASDFLSGLDHFSVSLDGGAPSLLGPGVSGTVLSGVPDGEHMVRVMAFDHAGNPASATLSFTVDTAVLSLNGPYGAWPLAALVAGVAVVVGFVAFWAWRRTKRPPAPEPKP